MVGVCEWACELEGGWVLVCAASPPTCIVLTLTGVTPTLWALMGYDGMVIRFEGPDDMRHQWTDVSNT